jgi:predicted nuclease with TOPRIM domain
MIEYIQIFQLYILPGLSIIALSIIIYLQISRKAVYEVMEKSFNDTLENNRLQSKIVISKHLEDIEDQAKHMLSLINEEIHSKLNQSANQISKLSEQLEQMTIDQAKLNDEISRLHDERAKLNDEIKKRDAIIERKSKQIKRLKDEI